MKKKCLVEYFLKKILKKKGLIKRKSCVFVKIELNKIYKLINNITYSVRN